MNFSEHSGAPTRGVAIRIVHISVFAVGFAGTDKFGGALLLHEHEVAVKTTSQPGNCCKLFTPRLARTALER